eukprot:TRINITY_DN1677_c0_g1_i2.p1 TRINITY_DN1677_c0_g1~~TRINITY_DN1677_c0_g1_i2.p1  ORF type:complete len:578 (+),score=89.57 TRINITY_DN1677_c0_g1_i2:22-1734(+)
MAELTLTQLLRTEELSRIRKFRVLHQVASHLARLHSESPPVVHGTLRCDAVQLSPTVGKSDDVLHVMAKSSPPILPPECMTSAQRTIGGDTFAFALLVWEVMTQRRVFASYSDAEIAVAVKGGLRLPIPEDWPAELRNLIHACWAHNATDRPHMRIVETQLSMLVRMEEDPITMMDTFPLGAREAAPALPEREVSDAPQALHVTTVSAATPTIDIHNVMKRCTWPPTNTLVPVERGASLGPRKLKNVRILKGHFGKIYAMSWSADGVHLATASQDGKIILWNAATCNKIRAIPLRSSWVMTVNLHPGATLVASGGLDNTITLHDVRTGKEIRQLAHHGGYVSSSAWLDGGTGLVSGSGDSSCVTWDVERGVPTRVLDCGSGDVMSVQASNRLIAAGACGGKLIVFDHRTGKQVCDIVASPGLEDINAVRFHPSGTAIGCLGDDATARLFDVRKPSDPLVEYCMSDRSSPQSGTGLDFSRCGRVLYTVHNEGIVSWDVVSAQQLEQNLNGHDGRVSCCAVNYTGNMLATGSWDTLVKVWTDSATWKEQKWSNFDPFHTLGTENNCKCETVG